MFAEKTIAQGLDRDCFEAITCTSMEMLQYEYMNYYIPFVEYMRRITVDCSSTARYIEPGKLLKFENIEGCDLKMNPQKNEYEVREFDISKRGLEKVICMDEWKIIANCVMTATDEFINFIMTEIGTSFERDIFQMLKDAIKNQKVLFKGIGGEKKLLDPANDGVKTINVTDPKMAGYNLLTQIINDLSTSTNPEKATTPDLLIGIVPNQILHLLQGEDRFIACCSLANITESDLGMLKANITGTKVILIREPYPNFLTRIGNDVEGIFFVPSRFGIATSSFPQSFFNLNKSPNILHPNALASRYGTDHSHIYASPVLSNYMGSRIILGPEYSLAAMIFEVMYNMGIGRIKPNAAELVIFKGVGVLDQVITNTTLSYAQRS